MFYSVLYESYCCVFVLGWMVGGVIYDCVSEGGFLVYETYPIVGVLWNLISRKFILLLDSDSAVSFMLEWIVLKSLNMLLMTVCFVS